MKKIVISLLLSLVVLLTPAFGYSGIYTLKQVFNQSDMVESLNEQTELYITKYNRDIEFIFDFRTVYIHLINECLEGKDISPDITLSAFKLYLSTDILLASIFDKEKAPLNKDTITKNTIILYSKLKEAGIIGGNIKQFMDMYNNALNYFVPRIIPKL